MELFDVYPRFPVTPVRGSGALVYDDAGTEYLDFYGGHAVISIGHAHPRFVAAIAEQAAELPFYSNSIISPLAERLATRLGELSGYPDYRLFLCNSGAEAIENGLKLASWQSGGDRVIAFDGAFHGRTSLAVAATDNSKLRAPVNDVHNVVHLPINDIAAFKRTIADGAKTAAVLIEGIQGISGIIEPSIPFLQEVAEICRARTIPLLLDEIQSGYGRSGTFFAHEVAGIRPDLITVAKGMGNGFPIGGLLIAPHFAARHGMLGTTFGGNHLACAAGLAVLDVIADEGLLANAERVGSYLRERLAELPGIVAVRGRGLMIGFDLKGKAAPVRAHLLHEKRVFTGSSANPSTLRLLPPLSITQADADRFLTVLAESLNEVDRTEIT